MQLSEFRDLLANDGFAATFQTMGQYRTELLRALDGLSAQADARPIGKVLSEEEMGIGYDRRTGPVLWFGTPKPGLIYPHPEASAPGLSDDGEVACSSCGLTMAQSRALTCASAATVAEPTVVQSVRICPISDVECAKKCSATCNHEAAQQQAEPGADERDGEFAYHSGRGLYETEMALAPAGWLKFAHLTLYARAYWIARAAQSGQRAGVAEWIDSNVQEPPDATPVLATGSRYSRSIGPMGPSPSMGRGDGVA